MKKGEIMRIMFEVGTNKLDPEGPVRRGGGLSLFLSIMYLLSRFLAKRVQALLGYVKGLYFHKICEVVSCGGNIASCDD